MGMGIERPFSCEEDFLIGLGTNEVVGQFAGEIRVETLCERAGVVIAKKSNAKF